jgi:predicted phosphoribosyltransferase
METTMERLAFRDRTDAGAYLASRLRRYAGRDDVVVLALPRGGVPVGHEIATALGAPLDVIVVRKLGAPGREELAMGAIARDGVSVLNEDVLRALAIRREVVESVAGRESREVERRERAYRGSRELPDVAGRVVILVDDGLATGASVRAAIAAVRGMRAGRVVVAVPVGAPSACREVAEEADEVVCASTPESFSAVGAFYADFRQTTDEEVCELLDRASQRRGPQASR